VSDLNINNPLGVSADGGVASGEQKTIRAISGGISVFYTISLWIQRLAGIAAAIFALCFTAYWWITSIHDITPGKTPLNAFMLLTLGLVLISYLIIIYIKLLRKPRTNPNAP
jgi:phage shock protein PspC (stress-responsive transcriptional regulator)